MRLVAILLLYAPQLLAADPAEVLQRAVAKFTSYSGHIPNYTCVQTVDRHYFSANAAADACASPLSGEPPPFGNLIATDRLRLEVTVAGRGEIYSWVGAGHFVDAAIDEVVRSGPIGSGAFAVCLNTAFSNNGSKLRFLRTQTEKGRLLMEYSFEVPEKTSNYSVKLVLEGGGWAKTAYSGTVQIDAETAEVVRLSVETPRLPAGASTCRTVTNIEFGNVRIPGSAFPLPAEATQRFVYPRGQETENITTFASCREYRAETKLIFDEPGTSGNDSQGRLPEPATLPPGLHFTLELLKGIDSDTAAAGDQFTAKLVKPLVDAHGKRLARAGTRVTGRLTRVATRLPTMDVILMLRPEIVEIPGAPLRVKAFRRITKYDKKEKPEVILRGPGEEGSEAIVLRGLPASLLKTYRTDWITTN